MTFARRTGRVVALLGLIAILVATLSSMPDSGADARRTPFWCLVCGAAGGVDVTLNLLLFIPFAFGLRLAGVSWGRVVAASALTTMFVEGMQYSVVAGRDASLSDLLTNTISGIIGATLGSYVRQWLMPRTTTARKLAAGWALGWLSLLVLTAWLMQPSPPVGPLRARWTPHLPSNPAPQLARVLSATFDGVPVRHGTTPYSTPHQRARGRNIELSFNAIVGEKVPYWAPIVTIRSSKGLAGAVFETGDDLTFEVASNARRFRFGNVALRLDQGRPAVTGEPIHVTAGARDGRLWLTSSYGSERRHQELGLSPNFGWSLLLPFDYAYGPEVHFLTGLWIAGLLFPLGYWARWARPAPPRRGAFIIGLGSVVVAGLALIPWLAGYPPVHLSEWLAAAVGVVGGWAAACRVTYLARECASPSGSESYSS